MEVFTFQEFESLNAGASVKAPRKRAEAIAPVALQPLPKRKIEYSFFYPDNFQSSYYSGGYIIGGVKHEIVNGVIKVYSEDDAKFLREKGFIFMFKNEVEEK